MKKRKKLRLVMNEITNFCENECGNKECCSEEVCILFRIEKIITNNPSVKTEDTNE